ncbi:uncharacterized protein GIQ15_02017 [Arthroderma uncinatum]|uniref:uncharacterized protein n=1 Tax=Arthroderma uncinatum TaxID=74035 RepID=UPI00144ADB89|nr:uncharacterized protein GIQ15_02017 [Arthroderma uncinatum]KAF3482693.1 hypothetical protein GIQ15_02017 [Arthroderma uncinatum]
MALRLFPRGRTASYYICIDGVRVHGSLDYNTVDHHIPHLRDCPRSRTVNSLGRPAADIDLTGVVHRCGLFVSQQVDISIFYECLRILVSTLRELQHHPFHDPAATLCGHLERLFLSHSQSDWSKQLKYFACFSYLFDESVLKASPALHRGMSTFVIRNARVLTHQAPLSISLQFADLCFHADFMAVMAAVFECLCSADRAELIRSRGTIPLYLSGRWSLAIIQYIFHHFGEKGNVCEKIKIRARRRVRRRQRHGPLDRGIGLFAWPR